jgi:hypothetical protein
MSPAERYLRLSTVYCNQLGGLRWSSTDDALEYPDGTTFALKEEVALFVEGFASTRGHAIHFAFILHLLDLLRDSDSKAFARSAQQLSRAFAAAGRPLRNAGVFCAALCGNIPQVTGSLDIKEVLDRLRDEARPLRWYLGIFHDTFYLSELPPLEFVTFEEEILRNLAAYTEKELRQWLRHGRGPIKEAGKALAQVLPPPRTLTGVLAELLERPRMAGARRFVGQLLSALALPPRQRMRPETPLGGYSEIATHGQPDQLLLSQFALDEWDFLRRYADRELLYFRREDPHVRSRHELVVLLDQGVRTWGDVRLVLGGAALALGRHAANGKMPFFMATTSSAGDLLNPLAMDVEALAEVVEASDLSAHPAEALERVLERPTEGFRDVVLLTHPRNLQEEDVRAAALRANTDTRLLALALDGNGEASLSELRHGAPVPLRRFRVDFNAKMPFPVADTPSPARPSEWRGDLDPVGFPFRFGTDPVGPNLFDFDIDHEWLLTASRDGLLHAWRTDGSKKMELLPRALVQGRLVDNIEAVVGVTGGFVVCCRHDEKLVAVHYDFDKRMCGVHVLGPVKSEHSWCYYQEHHVLLVGTAQGKLAHALDLGTGCCFPEQINEQARRRCDAWYAAASGRLQPRRLQCVADPETAKSRNLTHACCLDPAAGQLHLVGVQPPWKPFIPLANGWPVLKGCKLLEAECRGNILAVKVRSFTTRKEITLRLFRGPDGIPLAEYREPQDSNNPTYGFALSSDGNLLAYQSAFWRVEVYNTEGDTGPIAAAYSGCFSPQTHFLLGDSALLLKPGKQWVHFIHWNDGLLYTSHSSDQGLLLQAKPGLPAFLHYDPKRFTSWAKTTVTAVLDRFGQIAIFDANQELICMFYAFRDQLSAWMPDGTSFGPASPSGQPPTQVELHKFGRVLKQASDLGRSAACK